MSNARKLADNLPTEGSLSGRNLLTNGAMQIWQRGTSFSGNTSYNADRWNVDNNSGGGGQSTDAPDDFTYSLKIDPSSGNAALRQAIELPAAGKGGVFRSGQKFTLSFYLKSANAGEAINIFAASGTNVGATTTAQVNDTSTGLTTATSWTRYTYTFTSNNVGGSDTCYNIVPYVSSPSGATYWTGFQLESGSQASPFEHEPVGVTLSKCQRYFCKIENNTGSLKYFGILQAYSSANVFGVVKEYPAEMRTTPTVAQGGNFGCYAANSANTGVTTTIQNFGATSRSWFTGGWGTASSSSLTTGYASVTFWENGAFLTADAEL
jgi:hypothetical protein